MAEDILTPIQDSEDEEATPTVDTSLFLSKENFLSEFSTDGEKAAARENLEVFGVGETYNQDQINQRITAKVEAAIQKYADSLNYLDKTQIQEILINYIKSDGSRRFTAPVKGVTPTDSAHLTTKAYVDFIKKNLQQLIESNSINIEDVENSLNNYALKDKVYTKSEVYTKKEVNSLQSQFVKKDGSVSFTKPISGITPQINSHLSTKKYVDDVMTNHKTEIDPHGYTEILNNRLKKYALAANVLDKTQTYTRSQIDYIVDRLVSDAVSQAMEGYLALEDPYNILDKVKLLGYVNKDGSVPFLNPQKGIDAVNDDELITLRQLKEIQNLLSKEIDNKKDEWVTSGPVLSEVGLVEVGTEFSKTVTMQEVLDAIFYGKGINIYSPELGFIGESVEINICIRGDLASFEHGELYQNEVLIGTFDKGDFEDSGCITVNSNLIKEDTEFIFKAFYINGSEHEVKSTTKLSLPVFTGLIPKWKNGTNIAYSYLVELYKEDSVNNQFYDKGSKLTRVDHKYSFTDVDLKKPILAVPYNYPNLYQMCTPSQQFGLDAFDIYDVPMKVPGSDEDIVYRLYIYKEALVQLNIPVYFTFETNHE